MNVRGLGWVILGWAGLAGAAELRVDFTFSPEDVVGTAAGEYVAIGLVGGSRVVDEVGAPSIPAKFANILLPAEAENVSISASGEEALLAEGILPLPAQPRRPKSRSRAAYVAASDRYASAEPWPAAAATIEGMHEMQGYRFVSVRVNPLAYVGAEKKLVLREKVTVTVTYDETAPARAIAPKQAALFGPLVDSLVVNPSAAPAFAPKVRAAAPKATLDYLIVTSAALSNAFQRIADYRASTAGGGYTTRVLTTNDIGKIYSGSDIQAKIRACISNSVATLGTTMVLLGGDDSVVLDRDCYAYVPDDGSVETNMPTDLYYSGLSGSWNADGDARYGETSDAADMAWDVVVARLPMRTAAQVTNYLNRVKAYESGAPVTNKIILGGPEAWDTYTLNNRPSDDVTGDGHAGFRSTSPSHISVSDSEAWLRRLYRDGIRPYWPATVGIVCDTLTSWDTGTLCGNFSLNTTNATSRFNQNWTHLMFSGHGEPQGWGLESGDFTSSAASGLTGLTAFVYTDACLTGHFDKNSNTLDEGTAWEYTYTTEPCLAEGFLRNARLRGGALAYMGCARYGWGEPDAAPADNTARGGPSTEYAYKFYQRMYETTDRTLGVAFAMHKADMIGLSGIDGCERWIQFGMNLLGDPALKMPRAPSFAANPGPLGATTGVERAFAVAASGSPVPGLSLFSSTATPGHFSFAAATGVLTYAPPTNDVGARTFVFRATNALGAATQTVSVTVALAPPAAPAACWAAETNATDFTAAWSPVDGATSYRLDAGTDGSFSAASYLPGYSNRAVAGTSQSVTGLAAGATSHFRVRAVNGGGTGSYSSVATVSTRTTPVVPNPQPAELVQMPTNGLPISMRIPTTAGITYVLQFTTNLWAFPPIWVSVDTDSGDGNPLVLEDADSAESKRFYRVVTP